MKNGIVLCWLLAIGWPAAAEPASTDGGQSYASVVSTPMTLAAHHARKHNRHRRHRDKVVHTPVTGVEPRERRPESVQGMPGQERPGTPAIPPGPEVPLSSSAGPIDHNPLGTEPAPGSPSHRMPGTDMHPSPSGPIRP